MDCKSVWLLFFIFALPVSSDLKFQKHWPVQQSWPFRCAASMAVGDLGANLSGKTVLITGSDGQLGYPLSLAVVRSGATLVAGSRNAEKAEMNKERLSQFWDGPPVDTMVADLASFASVRTGVADVLSRHPVIDIVIHMAGVGSMNMITSDGFDMITQVNHLSPALVTELLLPSLAKSSSPRVVYIGSANMYSPVEGWDRKLSIVDQTWKWVTAVNTTDLLFHYSLSKLLVAEYASEQAVRHPDIGIFTVNPGYGRADAWNHSKYYPVCISGSPQPCPQYPEQAVTSTLFAASQPGIDVVSGSLIDFETLPDDKFRKFVQRGDSCVPRPMPLQPIHAHRSQWYDQVQHALRNTTLKAHQAHFV